MENITAKIQKLLSLANSDNQHEAELASKKANELLVKHNLKMQDVESHNENYDDDVLCDKAKKSAEDKFILSILNKFFFVQTVQDRIRDRVTGRNVTRIHILGKKSNVEVATYVYQYLTRAFKTLWTQYKAEHGCPSNYKQAFYLGLHTGLCNQLEQTKKDVEQETGLVVVKDADLADFVASTLGKTRSVSSKAAIRDRGAVQAGTEAGKNIRIRRGLDEGSSQSDRFLSSK